MTRDPEKFGEIATYHVLNDIWAAGAVASDLLISYGFNEEAVANGDASLIAHGVAKALAPYGIRLCNVHTLQATEISVSAAATGVLTGTRAAIEPSNEYSVVLTKPLGGAIASYWGHTAGNIELAQRGESLMLQAHGELVARIGSTWVSGTTDISGFGLLGHLAAFAAAHGCEVRLDLDRIPIADGIESVTSIARCAIERNREDFASLDCTISVRPGWQEARLYDAETSGPLACIVPNESVDDVLQECVRAGFANAASIGRVNKSTAPRVIAE